MLETSAWLLLSLLQVVHAPAAFVRGRLPIPVEVQSLDEDDRCAFEPGSDHPEMLAIGHCVAMRGGHLCTTHGGACMSRALLILSS